jgi:hypothetical protein
MDRMFHVGKQKTFVAPWQSSTNARLLTNS